MVNIKRTENMAMVGLGVSHLVFGFGVLHGTLGLAVGLLGVMPLVLALVGMPGFEVFGLAGNFNDDLIVDGIDNNLVHGINDDADYELVEEFDTEIVGQPVLAGQGLPGQPVYCRSASRAVRPSYAPVSAVIAPVTSSSFATSCRRGRVDSSAGRCR